MHYYQFHIADWTLHTAHLSLEEEAVYRRLLDYYYDTEQPIPTETHWVIRRLRLGSYAETVALILEEFFVQKPDGWHNLRADKEIGEYNAKAETARTNGKKGGRPKKQKLQNQEVAETANPEKTNSVSDGNQRKTGSKANQEPLTINQEPLTINQEPLNISPNGDMSSKSDDASGANLSQQNNPPNCPHQQIVDLYHQRCPTLPRVKILDDERKKFIRARWRQSDKHQTIEFWDRYFQYVNTCPLLIGEVNSWRADFEWLVRPSNFKKVIEGNYENRGAP